MAVLLAPVLVVLAVVSIALWVYIDARRWVRAGTPVEFRLGSIHIVTPEAWCLVCLVCLVFFVVFVPVYTVARRD